MFYTQQVCYHPGPQINKVPRFEILKSFNCPSNQVSMCSFIYQSARIATSCPHGIPCVKSFGVLLVYIKDSDIHVAWYVLQLSMSGNLDWSIGTVRRELHFVHLYQDLGCETRAHLWWCASPSVVTLTWHIIAMILYPVVGQHLARCATTFSELRWVNRFPRHIFRLVVLSNNLRPSQLGMFCLRSEWSC